MRKAAGVLAVVMLAGFMVNGAALAADPAQAAPADAFLYLEVNRPAVQEALAMAALPPVVGLIPDLGPFHDPFGHLDELLDQEAGTVNQAVRALQRAAFCVGPAGPMLLVSFDEAFAPARILPDDGAEAEGVHALDDYMALAVRGQIVCFASPEVGRRFVAGDYEALAVRERFRAARQERGRADVWAFADAPALMQLAFAQATRAEAKRMELAVDLLGLDDAEYAAFEYATDERAVNLMLRLGQPADGVLYRFPEGALDLVSLVPAEPSAALVFRWDDPVAFLGGVRDDMIRVDTTHFEGPLGEDIAAAEEALALRFDDLFAQLGAGFALVLPQPGPDGLLRPEQSYAVLPLADREGFRASLGRIAAAVTGAAPAERTVAGLPADSLMMPPLTVAYLEDRAVIGLAPAAIEAYAAWIEGDGPPMMEEPPQAAGLLYLDTGLLISSYPEPLPGTQLHLTLGRTDRDVRLTAREAGPPLSLGQAYKGYAAVMAAMLMPALSRARGEAGRAADRANLRNIGLALAMYRSEHDEHYPPGLYALVEKGYLHSPENLVSPGDPDPPRIGPQGYPCSYEYPGSLPADVPWDAAVAYTRRGVFADGRHVLFADGNVIFVPESQIASGWTGLGSLQETYNWLMERREEWPEDADPDRIADFYGMPRR